MRVVTGGDRPTRQFLIENQAETTKWVRGGFVGGNACIAFFRFRPVASASDR